MNRNKKQNRERAGQAPHLCQNKGAGQAALPTVILIGAIIIELAIAAVFISYILSTIIYGEKISAQALVTAEAGIEDALLRIARDKNFSLGYSITLSPGTADVNVIRNPASYPMGRHKIISVGRVLDKRRKIQAIVIVDPISGKVDLESIREIE